MVNQPFAGQAGNGHERRGLAAPHLQGDHRVAVEAGEQLVELLDRLQLGVLALVDQRQQHVALAHVRLGVGAHVGHHHPPGTRRSRFCSADSSATTMPRRLAGASACRLRRDRACRPTATRSSCSSPTVRVSEPPSAFAPDFQRRLRAGTRRADDARQVARALDRLAVERNDDVGRLDARLVRRAALLHRVDQRAARAVEAEGGGEVARHLLDDDADPAARDAALLPELLLHVERDVARDGERQAHEAAGAAVDLRVDADHLAAHVEQRPARSCRG